MFGIRLLGGFELSSADGSRSGRLGPKPQGLLAFLAMSRGVAVPRGRLAGLLWGERDEEAARHSLSQALTTLRSMLGPAATELQACPDGVRLAREGLELDVDAFESAAHSRQQATLQAACDLYRGEFLEGIDIREPGFEEWQLSERYRLGELAADAMARLLDLQIAAGDGDAAIATGRRLVAITPLDEPAHARLIELYGTLGRRGLAEAHYARCSELLRRELDQAPGDELRAALAEARRRPPGTAARFTAGPKAARAHDRPQNAKRRTKTVWITAGAAGAMLLLLAGLWTFHGNRIGDAGEGSSYEAAPWALPAAPSIAVMPFENLSGDPEQAYLADGITRDIITDLSKFSTLFVIAANSSFRYKGHAVKVQDVARDLGVRYLLEGSLQRGDDTLRIDANLIDATTGHHVWAERYERPTEDLFAVQKEITQHIAGVVGSERGVLLQAELDRIASKPTTSLAAYELFQRGVHHRNLETKEDTAIARQLFEKAVQLDPNYAQAIANLGMTYLDDMWGDWAESRDQHLRRAEELARRATQVDSSEPLGYVVLGLAYFLESQYDQAVPLLEKAKALNPNDDHITHAVGYVLAYSGVSPATGIGLLKDMQQRNPYYPEVILRDLAQAYFFAQRYEDALAALSQVARRHRPSYWLYRAASHAQLGQLDDGRAAIEEALRLKPDLNLEHEIRRRLRMGLAPKNAELLREAWHKAGLPARTASRPGAHQGDLWPLPAQPSIAVLPFENLSGDPEQAYFADGITNDITTDLSKFSSLFVTAANASFRYKGDEVKVQEVARDLGVRYVLEGSVQSAGGTLQINANLIDATSGRHVWADSYERPIEDLFAAQKEITRTIVGVIGSGWGELELAELERIARTPTEDLRAYELYLRGVAYKQRKTRESNTLARQMFDMAIEADPNYGRAMAECSLTYLNDVFNGWSGSRDDALQKAEELARRAIETDASEPWGLVTLGLVYQLRGWSERALALFEMAHTLNPNDYDITKAFGYAMTWSGSAEQAIELLERAQRLDPYEAGEPGHLAAAYFFAHRHRDALAAMNRIANREEVPGYWLYRAATHAQLGQLDQARAAIAEALKLDPELTLESEHERRLALGLAPAYAAQLTEALRKAGLPERRADLPQAAIRLAGRPTP